MWCMTLMFFSRIIDWHSKPNTSRAGVAEERNPAFKSTKSKEKKRMRIAFISMLSTAVLILGLSLVLFLWRKRYPKKPGLVTFVPESSFNVKNQKEDSKLPLFDLATIVHATGTFSMNNKLGGGGFGAVYKGILKDRQEIAVKRLTESSGQGLD